MKPFRALQGFLNKKKPSETGESSPKSLSSHPDLQTTEPFPIGVKVWVPCDDADVDICFIHGLSGNRDSTWTAPGQTEPWPKTLLPKELPNLKARILTYGYDAYPVHRGHASSERMTDHAMKFLQKVVENREKDHAMKRPLIILAHSLGGLVSKQAVLKSKISPEIHLQNLYNMIIGIIFMGTPHTGAWMADWSKIPADVFGILKSTNTSLLRVLQTKDELLHSLNVDFLSLLRVLRESPENDKKINVKCFYEELGYPKVGKIVSTASATFASDPAISVYANHSSMVKFSSTADDGFSSVAAELNRWTNTIRQSRANQLQSIERSHTSGGDPVGKALELLELPNTDSTRTAIETCFQYLGLEDDTKLLLELGPATDPRTSKQRREIEMRIKDAYRRATARCRHSLAFDDMLVREENIARPEKETCEWIYQDYKYQKWITNKKPLLWVKGNPGSGKSILMKSLFRQRQKDLKDTSTILLRFFFNARGSSMERSREALYRTMLHSFISMAPSILCEFLVLYLEKEARGDSVRWQTTELAEIFHEKLQYLQFDDIEILIDALDECSDAEVLDVVRRFENSILAHNTHAALRVCWSSRFYPNINLRVVQGTELIVNEKNNGDIREYIQKLFPVDLSSPLWSVSESLVSRAKGIFLWATLVADKLIKACDEGKDAGQLQAMLQDIPEGLDNLFLNIFKKPGFTSEQLEDLRRILPFVLEVAHPLSIEELHTAILLGRAGPNSSVNDITPHPADTERFKKRLVHASGGLIESIGTRGSTRVQAIHESVRDFFFGKGLLVLESTKEEFLKECHSEIVRAAFNGLSKLALDAGATRRSSRHGRDSAHNETLTSLVPRRSWKPSEMKFLAEYVRDYVFTHFDYICSTLTKEDGRQTWLPPARLCREALYGYLRAACFDVINCHGLKRNVNHQLRVVSNHARAFDLDNQIFADLLDFPNCLMASLGFLKRRVIRFDFDDLPPHNDLEASHTCRFLAVFSASYLYHSGDWQLTKPSKSLPDENQQAIVPNNKISFPKASELVSKEAETTSFSEGDHRLSSKEISKYSSFLFAISIVVPPPAAAFLLSQPQLLSESVYYPAVEDDFPVIVGDWQFVRSVDPELHSLLPKDLQCRQRGHLTFSKPYELECRLFRCRSPEEKSSRDKTEYVNVAEGSSAIEWEDWDGRDVLFGPW